MIDLYTWPTPNGRKISIALEEFAAPYEVHPVNLQNDEQFAEHFLAISPNNKIPAIIDRDNGMSLMESGAILVYLAEKYGKFLPKDSIARAEVNEWLMWQMGGVGPMFGQAHHFMFNPKEVVPYGQKRYHDETKRLYMVMNDRRLNETEYLAGGFYSIADIAVYPWVSRHERHEVDLNEFPNVKRWFDTISAREAVQKGMAVPFAN